MYDSVLYPYMPVDAPIAYGFQLRMQLLQFTLYFWEFGTLNRGFPIFNSLACSCLFVSVCMGSYDPPKEDQPFQKLFLFSCRG